MLECLAGVQRVAGLSLTGCNTSFPLSKTFSPLLKSRKTGKLPKMTELVWIGWTGQVKSV